MTPPRKLHIKSYGCQMNVYDAQRMADTLAPEGFVETASAEDADLVILNTCHIREKASEKVYSELGRLRVAKDQAARDGRRMDVVVAGCVAQAEGEEIIRRAPVVDVVVGPQSYHHLPQLLARAKADGRALETEFPVEDKFGFLPQPSRQAIRARGISAFVTVQEGCDKFCTFCVVPYTRGAEVSRPVAKIVEDVQRLADNGVREITLIGQNVNAYHGDGPDGRPWPFGKLLHRLAEIPGIVRLRYSTSHPRDVEDCLIDAHRDLDALMPFVHLPVQSGSDRILAAMNRKHTADDYRRVIDRFRHVPAGYRVLIGLHRRLPGRNRGRFRRDPRACHANRIRWRLFVQVFAAARNAGGGNAGDGVNGRHGRATGAASESDRQPAIRLQRAAVGKTVDVLFERAARNPGQIVGRTAYLQPAHVDGIRRHHRTGAARNRREPGTLQPVRNAGASGTARSCTMPPAHTVPDDHRSLNPCPRAHRIPLHLLPAGNLPDMHAPPETQVVIDFEDNRAVSALVGPYGQNLAQIERRLGVVVDSRGNHITITGSRDGCDAARRVLETLYTQAVQGHDLSQGEVEGAIRAVIAQGSLFEFDAKAPPSTFEAINLRKRPVRARTAAQDLYIRALKRHELVFGSAPRAPARPGSRWRRPRNCSSARRSIASS